MKEKTESLMESAVLNDRTNKILKYVVAYNSMNVEKTMELRGIEEFKKQAIEAVSYFSERYQSIETLDHNIDSTEIVLSYQAVAAMDFPNGLKKGDEITLKGKSIFEFSTDGKIVKLTDIA